MEGKTVMVTGATAGIGKATALELARLGAQVIVVGRNLGKSQEVVGAIRQTTGNPHVDYLLADLSSIEATTALAEQAKARYERLDVLINNVGAVFLSRGETVDGIEKSFALNYLVGRFLLTHLLLDLLRVSAPARIVNVSSSAHSLGKIHFADPGLRRGYTSWKAYSQAKLADVMFTYELARRLEGTGVTANVLHPGVVSTRFLLTNNRDTAGTRLMRWITDLFAISAAQGAEPSVYLATAPELESVTGQYFKERRVKASAKASRHLADQQRLWAMSEQMLQARMPMSKAVVWST